MTTTEITAAASSRLAVGTRIRDRRVELTVDESMARNRHAVLRKDIERMAKEWEPWEEKNDE